MERWRHLGTCLIRKNVGANSNYSHLPELKCEIASTQLPVSRTWATFRRIIVLRSSSLQAFASSCRGFVNHRDPSKPPKLLVVQPRIHPKPLLRARLLEALRLADSLHGLRKGEDDSNLGHGLNPEPRQLSPFVLVQSTQKSASGLKKQINAGHMHIWIYKPGHSVQSKVQSGSITYLHDGCC
ncbi:hypothetical protein O6H91_04G123600 [Diphasiastrum complanatum]|uniref:Uncharacterized protein n=1 Tax=Diphasiastrum complanatum TaxID=34168 RepID=A0ACC2E1B9_DIPCM|nr:hypothetical protein O6H91_04G123600 [Diphasiastrum complanatum]